MSYEEAAAIGRVGTPFRGLSGLRGWKIPPEVSQGLRELRQLEIDSLNSDVVFSDKPERR